MKILLSEKVLTQDLDNELVLMNIDSGRYFGLEPTGCRVWKLLAETGDSEVVIRALLSEYDADETIVRRDVEELIDGLEDAGLATRQRESA